MSELLDQLNDDALDFRVTFTDTDGCKGTYEFLDLVFLGAQEYAVVSPVGSDGDVEIFSVLPCAGFLRLLLPLSPIAPCRCFLLVHDNNIVSVATALSCVFR